MKVLHDWDHTFLPRSWALRRGISLVVYSMTLRFPILNRFPAIRRNTLKIENEKIDYMETLIRLDRIAGITPVFGIRDSVRERYGDRINKLQTRYNVDIRRHIHIGENSDPKRERMWEPPLTQSRETWAFDSLFLQGKKVILKPGELPVFHIDQPRLIKVYIDYLFDEREQAGE